MSILFENCTVVTSDEVLSGVNLGVDGEYIDYLGKDKPAKKYDSTKNMSGKILLPGLYNCHTHTPMVLLRGVGSDLPLNEWLFDKIFPVEDRLTPEHIRTGSELALLEMLSSGTVSFSDMYFEPQQTIETVVNAGMKANICRPVQSFDPNERAEDSFRIKQSLELFEKYNGFADGKILVDFCIHAEYTCNEKITKAYSEICSDKKGNMHIHLSETDKEHNECIAKYGCTPAEWFLKLGAFDSRAFAAHCVALTDSDMDIMKAHNISIVHNPTSNMKLGSGFAPVQKFLKKGINVTLGTDGAASNNNLNMLEEMHLASVIHNGFMKDATVMKPQEILKMVSINGAMLQGREDCGEIKVGKKADICAVSLDAPHMHPVLDVPALITYSSQSSDVCMTMCDGKILYENGEYKTLDKERIYFDVEKCVKELYC